MLLIFDAVDMMNISSCVMMDGKYVLLLLRAIHKKLRVIDLQDIFIIWEGIFAVCNAEFLYLLSFVFNENSFLFILAVKGDDIVFVWY